MASRTLDRAKALKEVAPLVRAMRRAVRDAIERHAKLDEDVVIWEDGKVKTVPAKKVVAQWRRRAAAKRRSSRKR